jgi:hypothetical protein
MGGLNLVDQLSQLLAGIKHADLHGGAGNAEMYAASSTDFS